MKTVQISPPQILKTQQLHTDILNLISYQETIQASTTIIVYQQKYSVTVSVHVPVSHTF